MEMVARQNMMAMAGLKNLKDILDLTNSMDMKDFIVVKI